MGLFGRSRKLAGILKYPPELKVATCRSNYRDAFLWSRDDISEESVQWVADNILTASMYFAKKKIPTQLHRDRPFEWKCSDGKVRSSAFIIMDIRMALANSFIKSWNKSIELMREGATTLQDDTPRRAAAHLAKCEGIIDKLLSSDYTWQGAPAWTQSYTLLSNRQLKQVKLLVRALADLIVPLCCIHDLGSLAEQRDNASVVLLHGLANGEDTLQSIRIGEITHAPLKQYIDYLQRTVKGIYMYIRMIHCFYTIYDKDFENKLRLPLEKADDIHKIDQLMYDYKMNITNDPSTARYAEELYTQLHSVRAAIPRVANMVFINADSKDIRDCAKRVVDSDMYNQDCVLSKTKASVPTDIVRWVRGAHQ